MARYNGSYFPPSVPLKAKGGIKAHSTRGAFGKNWWARRWVETLESFKIGSRLNRGRNYARKGQVLSINVDKGEVRAEVQGSRARPYVVTIKVRTLAEDKWKSLAKALTSQAFFAAKLLAGEMPENIEEAFSGVGLSLFPDKSGDLETDCSCPDWSNPCKHIAAVYYLLGEEFDRDPFLIFKLRGMAREDLVGLLGGNKSGGARASRSEGVLERSDPPPEPLPVDPVVFWSGATDADEEEKDISVPAVCAALPKQLGSFPFWRGQKSFMSSIETFYGNASPLGLDVFLGEGLRSRQNGEED
ncbi:MAG: SWIM zinc finger family protein [Desulfatibacillaceae bacterium]